MWRPMVFLSRFAVSFLAICFTAHVAAQLPHASMQVVSPAGGKVGSQFDVRISGDNLDQLRELRFSHPGITAVQKTRPANTFFKTSRPINDQFTVKIADNVPPGLYEVRAVGYFGMTNPRAFQVATLKELHKAAGNSSREKAMAIAVGSVVNGHADKDTIDYYKLALVKGQRVLIDCWGQRIDSRIDPTLGLVGPDGQELATDTDTTRLDAVLDFQAPADGEYTLAVHDFTYEGGADYFYRLLVHSGPFIDFVFPPVGEPGKSGSFTLYGRNLPGGKPVANVPRLEQLDVKIPLAGEEAVTRKLAVSSYIPPHAGAVASTSYQLKGAAGVSNPVRIGFATAPMVVEAEPNNDVNNPQQVNPPCEYVGQFHPRGDRDWVQFDAKKGEAYWIEVISHRQGLATDPVLTVDRLTPAGEGKMKASQVTSMDDVAAAAKKNVPVLFNMRSKDPQYRLDVKADGIYRVGVRDLYGDSRGGLQLAYRLVIRKAQPDFQLVAYCRPPAEKNKLNACGAALRRGQTLPIKVHVLRRDGFAGEIEISAEGLPAGLSCSPAISAGGNEQVDLVFVATDNAPAWAGTIQVVGKSTIAGRPVIRHASSGSIVWGTQNAQNEPPMARMTRDIGLSVIDKESAPAGMQAGEGKVLETSVGGKITVPLKVRRFGEFKGPLKAKITGVPKEIQAKEANITGDSASVEISLANNKLPAGTYTCYFTAPAKFKYARNPEAVKTAQAQQKELTDTLKQMNEQAKQMADMARKARDEANKKREDKALAEAARQADEQAKAADERRKQADKLKKEMDKKVQELVNLSKPKDITVNVLSSPVCIRVAPTPIVLKAVSPGNAAKQGEKIELPVTVERKYGFEDQVDLSLESPKGTTGISAKRISVPKGQTEGKLELTLAKNATPGKHRFTLRGRVRFNNVQLDQTESIELTIAPGE